MDDDSITLPGFYDVSATLSDTGVHAAVMATVKEIHHLINELS